MQSTIDNIVNKLSSRKFAALVAATVLVLNDKLDSESWLYIAIAYLGANAATSIGHRISAAMEKKSEWGYLAQVSKAEIESHQSKTPYFKPTIQA